MLAWIPGRYSKIWGKKTWIFRRFYAKKSGTLPKCHGKIDWKVKLNISSTRRGGLGLQLLLEKPILFFCIICFHLVFEKQIIINDLDMVYWAVYWDDKIFQWLDTLSQWFSCTSLRLYVSRSVEINFFRTVNLIG